MSKPKNTVSDISLLQHLDLPQVNCLNESIEHPIRAILSSKSRNSSDDFLESDADEQMLLNIYFNQKVRVRSIVIHSKIKEQAPKEIKLLTNKSALGFEDVEEAGEAETAQMLAFSEEDVTLGNPISLRFVRFQNVNSLHIFVLSNQGQAPTTRIDSIDIFGHVDETSNKDLSGLAQAASN